MNRPILLAAGGTGGHMFPAEATARALIDRGHRVELVTDRRGSAFGDSLSQVPVHRLMADTIRPGFIRKLTAGFTMAWGVVQALWLVARLRPRLVVGFGGYPSVPAVIAAAWLGVPVVLHEQNAVIGRANAWLAPRADRIAVSFERVIGIRPDDRAKLVVTGIPVRPSVRAIRDLPYPALAQDGPVELLVTGGSQGATVFSTVVPAAVTLLPDHLKARLKIAHQARPADLDAARATYAEAGIAHAEIASFFADLPARLAACHLAICRAGASTIAELTEAGRPAILVPLPTAMDDHQTVNAEAMVESGGAWLMPQPAFTTEALAARLETLMTLPESLARAADKARGLGGADAAARLADLVESLLPKKAAA